MPKHKPKILAMFEGQEVMDKTEFLQAFKKVIDAVLKKEKTLEKAVAEMRTAFQSLQKKLGDDNTSASDKLNRTITAELESLLRRFAAKSKELDIKMGSIKDGKDADEDVIVDKVLSQIKLPEYKETVLDNAEQLRDKLESLKGEEQLKLSIIDEFKKEIAGLRKQISNIPRGRGGGGRKTTYITRVNLTDQTNGTLKSFSMPKDTLAVLAVGGTDFPITYDDDDFTLTGNTLTLNIDDAPTTGSTLFALVEKMFYG